MLFVNKRELTECAFFIVGSGSTERERFEEMKAENSYMKEVLNVTRLLELRKLVEEVDVKFIRNELKRQKNTIANLTTLVS